MISQSNADVLLLQETKKNWVGAIASAVGEARALGWRALLSNALLTMANGVSGGCAVLTQPLAQPHATRQGTL